MNRQTSFKVGKLYVCRNPLPKECDTWYWVLFDNVRNWRETGFMDQKVNMLCVNEVFMVLETFNQLDSECIDDITYWIKVVTHAGIVGWFRYSSVYAEEQVVEEFNLC